VLGYIGFKGENFDTFFLKSDSPNIAPNFLQMFESTDIAAVLIKFAIFM
jgi:hypothetical protein